MTEFQSSIENLEDKRVLPENRTKNSNIKKILNKNVRGLIQKVHHLKIIIERKK